MDLTYDPSYKPRVSLPQPHPSDTNTPFLVSPYTPALYVHCKLCTLLRAYDFEWLLLPRICQENVVVSVQCQNYVRFTKIAVSSGSGNMELSKPMITMLHDILACAAVKIRIMLAQCIGTGNLWELLSLPIFALAVSFNYIARKKVESRLRI